MQAETETLGYSEILTSNLIIMGSYTEKEKNIMRNAGYNQTSDSDVWKKDNHTITRRTETTIFNTDRHTTNGNGISESLFSKKAK